MSDVMISYSRKDLEFVRSLSGALGDGGLDVWVDLDGIFVGEEFKPQLHAAIEAADNLLFIISPHSVVSDWCRKELEHAVACNKRIIPFVYRQASEEALPRALRDREWFVFKSSDLANGFDRLIEEVQTDPHWRRTHTRYLVRAREWEKTVTSETDTGDDSYLLRGRDLQEAIGWLQQPSAKQPALLPLHSRFIATSQYVSARKQRRTIVVLSLMIALIAAVSVVAIYQRHVAIEQRDLALSNQVKSQSNYGAALIGQKADPVKAIATLTSAAAICKTFDEPRIDCAKVQYNLGDAYRDSKAFEKALRAYRAADMIVRSWSQQPGNSITEHMRFLANTFTNMAYCHTLIAGLGSIQEQERVHYDLAAQHINDAVNALSRLPGDPLNDRLAITRVRVAIGLGDWDHAKDLLNEVEMRLSTESEPSILLLKAIVCDCTQQGTKALEYLREFRRHFGKSASEREANRKHREYDVHMQYFEKVTDKCLVRKGDADDDPL